MATLRSRLTASVPYMMTHEERASDPARQLQLRDESHPLVEEGINLHTQQNLSRFKVKVFLTVFLGFVTLVLISKWNGRTSPEQTFSRLKLLPVNLTFHSGAPVYDAAFELALKEVAENMQDDGTFVAGAGWTQLWTRDTSYALELGLALLYPQASHKTLMSQVQNKKYEFGTTWLQDECGHFGGWPNLTDAIVGAQGSWSLYLATGDRAFLEWAHSVTQNTLRLAEAEVFDGNDSALFKGCSSFMESNSGYPAEYKHNGSMVGQTKALSTNILYYNGYKLAAEMQQEIQRQVVLDSTGTVGAKPAGNTMMGIAELRDKANRLKNAIRSRFWLEQRGYYAYFEDAQNQLVQQMEGLGESLLLLSDLEDNQTRINKLFANTYRTEKGFPNSWPRFKLVEKHRDSASYYHNGRIWPFVQGYWAIAAARYSQVDVFAQELDHLVELALLLKGIPDEEVPPGGDHRYQPTFAEFYETNGSFLKERRRQLWSAAGFLGMVLHGLCGIILEPRGLRFRPVKPPTMLGKAGTTNTITLSNLHYRKAVLTIQVSGSGAVLDIFRINGQRQTEPFLGSDASGEHLIEITLKQKPE